MKKMPEKIDISILFVDDEVEVLKAIGCSLKFRFKEVYLANSVKEALELYTLYQPKVVLTDLVMPEQNGLELAKTLKQLNPSLPLIAITAHSEAEMMLQAFDVGFDDYLVKPINAKDILEKVLKVTEFNRAKEELISKNRELKEEFSLLINTIPDGAWVWNIKAGTLFVSSQWKKMLGFEDDELENHPDTFFHRVHPQDLPLVREEIEKHLSRQSDIYIAQFRLLCKNGEYKWIRARGRAVFEQEGTPDKFFGIHEDLDEEMKLKEIEKNYLQNLHQEVERKVGELREKDVILAQQGRFIAMGEMLSMIAHQWRQPLNAMSAAAINLKLRSEMGSLNDTFITDHYKFIEEQTQHMSRTINDFMNFFRPQNKKETFSLKECIGKVIKIVDAQLKVHSIDMRISVDQNIYIYGAQNEMEHILLNLISNARDAIEANGGLDRCICVEAKSCDSRTLVSVKDSGGGIPSDIRDKIFDPYFTTKPVGKGTGIGLYMTKTIIEQHFEGSVMINETENGSEFVLDIPTPNKKA